MFIHTMAAIGQTYDLKKVTPEMIRKRKARTGDVFSKGNYGLYHPNDHSTPHEELDKEILGSAFNAKSH